MFYKVKPILFKLYSNSGRRIMTREFDNDYFVSGFFVAGRKLCFRADTSIEIAEYESHARAIEVRDQIIDAYRAHISYSLP